VFVFLLFVFVFKLHVFAVVGHRKNPLLKQKCFK